ncbi:MAG: hypothetical protein IJ933_00480, partial [Bacteroidales bacterium]|nr:hypothetical protein [Bacteroidales bacterium]
MSRRIVFLLLIAIGASVLSACDGDVGGRVDGVSLDGSWQFIKADSSSTIAVQRQLLSGGSVAGCERVVLPHSGCMASLSYDSISADGVGGNCYYYRKFVVPSEMSGKRMSLFFEGVVHHCGVWINGIRSMVHYGNTPFVVDFVPMAGENTVVVKLDSDGAICNNVWLISKDSLSITNEYERLGQFGGVVVNAHYADGNGKFAIKAMVRNSYSEARKARLSYHILDHNGKEMGHGGVSHVIGAGMSDVFDDSIEVGGITP